MSVVPLFRWVGGSFQSSEDSSGSSPAFAAQTPASNNHRLTVWDIILGHYPGTGSGKGNHSSRTSWDIFFSLQTDSDFQRPLEPAPNRVKLILLLLGPLGIRQADH